LRWVIDPLDGTVNYLYGHPQWCVSVAVEDSEGPLAGVVLDVLRDEEFSAVRSGAPMLNGNEFDRPDRQPVGDDPLAGVLLATGFHYEASVRERQAGVFSGLIPRVRDIRRGGSAALDLCWAAIGRVDAYAEHGVREWDVAAGGLICLAAGLEVEMLPTPGWPVGMAAGEAAVVAELAEAFSCGGPGRSWPQMRLG
jgi:myo-inositol-1(or 4)-monophosphatase